MRIQIEDKGKQMKKVLAFVTALFFLNACATNPDGTKLDTTDETTLEAYNRSVFNFNYQLDKKVLKPVAKGYKSVTNQFFRDRVTTFFNNLEEPASAINNLLQGNVKSSGVSVGRFVINSTLGLLGTFDVATGWKLVQEKADFDGTLAKYCVPDGPFVVIPVLGPATPRYLVGWGADSLASPTFWALYDVDDDGVNAVAYGAYALKYVNKRAEALTLTDDFERNSVDLYTTMKSAFMQNRQKYASLCAQTAESENLSYDFDFDDEEDE